MSFDKAYAIVCMIYHAFAIIKLAKMLIAG